MQFLFRAVLRKAVALALPFLITWLTRRVMDRLFGAKPTQAK